MATAPTSHKHLSIYLNDHLGASTAEIELARRIAGENEGTELGTFMDGLVQEIAADRRTLDEVMRTFGVPANPVKTTVAWVGEKIGRLKLNGSLTDYSPLSRVEELEALSLGIDGKRLMWVAFAETPVAERIGQDRLAELARRAEQQRAGVERFRRDAARQTFADAS